MVATDPNNSDFADLFPKTDLLCDEYLVIVLSQVILFFLAGAYLKI
tara:strand:+ start:8719 stop:8856 length:138 start_codon:yes stop_codon:yes gene_type:complete